MVLDGRKQITETSLCLHASIQLTSNAFIVSHRSTSIVWTGNWTTASFGISSTTIQPFLFKVARSTQTSTEMHSSSSVSSTSAIRVAIYPSITFSCPFCSEKRRRSQMCCAEMVFGRHYAMLHQGWQRANRETKERKDR